MSNLNVAVVGCGQMGWHHAKIYQGLPGVTLKAICEANKERRDNASKEFHCDCFESVDSMFEKCPDIEAVSITMPDNLHLDVVKAAMKRQVHILLEKPIAKELKDGVEIEKLASNYNKTFLVGHLLRYDPRFYGMKQAIDKGELGDIIHLTCRRNSPIVGPLRYIGASDLGIHVLIHDADYVNWFIGCKAVKVFARTRSVALKQYDMQDVIYAIITYENGVIVNMEASWVLPKNSPTIIDDQVEIVGTKGTAYIDSCDHGLRFVTESNVLYPDTRHWPYVDGRPSGALNAELASFVTSIVSGTKPLSTAKDALQALKVIDAIERSIASGKEVTL